MMLISKILVFGSKPDCSPDMFLKVVVAYSESLS